MPFYRSLSSFADNRLGRDGASPSFPARVEGLCPPGDQKRTDARQCSRKTRLQAADGRDG